MRTENWMREIHPRRFRNQLCPRLLRRSHMRRSGAELLELGLVLGLLLLPIMFGTIEFGTYFYVEHNLQSAAREGARAACVFSDHATQDAAAKAAAQQLLQQSSLWSWGSFKNNVVFNTNWQDDPLHPAQNGQPGQQFVIFTATITWDKIPDGMRPMRMITNPQNTLLKGVRVMRVEQ